MMRELEEVGCLGGAQLVYSLWPGYLEDEQQEPFRSWLERLSIPTSLCHTSGHASAADLRRLVDALTPRTVVPIHTEVPERFVELWESASPRADGEGWAVGAGGRVGEKPKQERAVKHPLHVAVADELERRLDGRGELIRDPACVGDSSCGRLQHLPLFVGSVKGRVNHMCDADLLVLSGGKVRVIVEIEESGFLPTKICGKFLQAALATHFIHDSHEGQAVPYDCVLFVQVIDGSKALRPGSK